MTRNLTKSTKTLELTASDGVIRLQLEIESSVAIASKDGLDAMRSAMRAALVVLLTISPKDLTGEAPIRFEVGADSGKVKRL